MPEIRNCVFSPFFDRNSCQCLLYMIFLCLYPAIFRLYRCEPSDGVSSSANQQLQELYAQVPQVRLHFSHGFDVQPPQARLSLQYLMTFNKSLICAAHAHSNMYARTVTQVSVEKHTQSYAQFLILLHLWFCSSF